MLCVRGPGTIPLSVVSHEQPNDFNSQNKAGGGAAAPKSLSIPRGQITFKFADPFPARIMKELVYKDTFLQFGNPGSNQQAATALVFNLGSLYEPRSGGHQPFGFDQMAALYARYKVHKVHILVETIPSAVTGAAHQVVAIFPPGSTQTTTGALVAGNMGENFNVSTQMVIGNAVAPVKYQTTLDISTIAGLTKSEFLANVEDYSALVTASPVRYPFLEVNNAPAIAGQGGNFYYNVTLTYVAEFWQRVSLAGS